MQFEINFNATFIQREYKPEELRKGYYYVSKRTGELLYMITGGHGHAITADGSRMVQINRSSKQCSDRSPWVLAPQDTNLNLMQPPLAAHDATPICDEE